MDDEEKETTVCNKCGEINDHKPDCLILKGKAKVLRDPTTGEPLRNQNPGVPNSKWVGKHKAGDVDHEAMEKQKGANKERIKKEGEDKEGEPEPQGESEPGERGDDSGPESDDAPKGRPSDSESSKTTSFPPKSK